jgi:hypothetical protein
MRKRLLGLFLCVLALGPLHSRAEIGVLDNVPAATLLLPYFEVDLNNPNGVTTLFSVNAANHVALLAHVTLWSDLGIPSQTFNIYLTGYDTQTVNLRDIFNGVFPRTASAGQDPGDTSDPNTGISNKGPLSQDINFASCSGQLPYATPALNPLQLDDLRRGHTGLNTVQTGGRCVGRNLGDNIARGYVTIDLVNFCTLQFPSDPGYFVSGGAGSATNQNLLWGDYFLLNASQNFAQGESLVALEASAVAFVPGDYTFYGRLVGGIAADNREPLATNWVAPYSQNAGGATTDLLVWRDAAVPPIGGGGSFNCALPGPFQFFPLGQTDIVAFDSEENPTDIAATGVPFPGVAGRVQVGGPDLSEVTPRSGWLYLNLNTFVSGSPLPPPVNQSYVTVIRSSQGRFSGGHAGIPLDDANNPLTSPILP